MTTPQATAPAQPPLILSLSKDAHPEPVEGPRATTRPRPRPSALRTPGWEPLEDLIPADLFKAEARHWATRIGVTLREIHVRPMPRKWASCSTRGRLTFSHDLLRQPAPSAPKSSSTSWSTSKSPTTALCSGLWFGLTWAPRPLE